MKVLVIGTGFGATVMAPAWQAAGCSVSCVSARDASGIAAGLVQGADIASVHSPPLLHRDHVDHALDRGIAVLCDKPFGLDADAARAMTARAQALGIPNFVNFELRFQPARVKAKALVDAGAIGTLRHVSWTMFGNGLRDIGWGWLSDRGQGGGWLGAYGAHGIDFLRWLTGSDIVDGWGKPRNEVTFREDRYGRMRPASAEDAFTAWFETANGVTAMIDTGFSGSVAFPERLLLLGSDGALELIDDWNLIRHLPDGQRNTWAFDQSRVDRYGPAMAEWLMAILDRLGGRVQAEVPDFGDGLAVTEMLDRLKASWSAGRKMS